MLVWVFSTFLKAFFQGLLNQHYFYKVKQLNCKPQCEISKNICQIHNKQFKGHEPQTMAIDLAFGQ